MHPRLDLYLQSQVLSNLRLNRETYRRVTRLSKKIMTNSSWEGKRRLKIEMLTILIKDCYSGVSFKIIYK